MPLIFRQFELFSWPTFASVWSWFLPKRCSPLEDPMHNWKQRHEVDIGNSKIGNSGSMQRHKKNVATVNPAKLDPAVPYEQWI